MRKHPHRRRPPAGSRPGTLVIDAGFPAPQIRLIQYSPDSIRETAVGDVGKLESVSRSPDSHWIDVQGLGDLKTLEALGRIFSIHPLALEDIVHVPIRPKAETYDEHLVLFTRMLRFKNDLDLDWEQVGLFVGRNYVLTFQERPGDVLDPVRERLRAGHPRIRASGPGYLAYAILDTIVDAYFPVSDHIVALLEELEPQLIANPTPQALQRLHDLKNVLVKMRKAVVPQREAVNTLIRDPSPFMDDHTRVYLRDTFDHCVLVAEAVETSREFVNGLMNTYLSALNHRTNQVMTTLTIVTSIFVPLTFMTGIYGMNFDTLPELRWRLAYPVLLLCMALVAGGMLFYFRRRGWLGSSAVPDPRDTP